MNLTCRRRSLAGFCMVLGISMASTVGAEAPAKSAHSAAVKPASDSLPAGRYEGRLKSADPAEVKAALEELRDAGKRASATAPAVADLLRRGTSPTLAALALSVLANIGTPAQTAAVLPYARHRLADLRSKAITALGTCGGDQTLVTLQRGLSDTEPAVRGVAASALGAQKAHAALPELYAALDHNVFEAAAAIGEVCMADECAAFAAKTGKLGLDVMTSGFDAILFRPSTQVPDEQKIKIVERVRDLRTQEANKYLRDVQTRMPPGGARLKQAIEQAVTSTAGAAS